MHKKFIIAALTLMTLSSVVVFGSSNNYVAELLESVKNSSVSKALLPSGYTTSGEKTTSKQKNKSAESIDDAGRGSTDIPDEVIYYILFNHLVMLKEKAAEMQSRGEVPIDYHGSYMRQANLAQSESEILFQTAQDCIDAVRLIDEEAKEVITEARKVSGSGKEVLPEGQVQDPENPPPPPAELGQLQQEREAAILQYRDALEKSLGVLRFADFNQFARQRIAPQVNVLSKSNPVEKGGSN